jgi:uncharacterized protein (TIGR02246 family)
MNAASPEPSTQTIVALYTQLLDAWNRRDADGFAELFTEHGSIVGFDGSQMNGRAECRTQLSAIFASHPTASYVAKVREVSTLDARVSLLRAVVGMLPPGQDALNPAVNAVQSVVIVYESARPRIALLHNTPAAFHGRPQLSEQLTTELTAVVHSGRVVETT